MLSPADLQMYESIARHVPKYRQHLQMELEKQTEILVQAVEESQIRRAQGYAACLKHIIGNLDASLTRRS